MLFNSSIYNFIYVLSTNLSSSLFSYKILKSSFDFMINYDIELQKTHKSQHYVIDSEQKC